MQTYKHLILPLVILLFYPLIKLAGDMIGGPDIPQLLYLLWTAILAWSGINLYNKSK